MNMKIPISHIATIILLLTASLGNLAAQHVKTGIDVLEENGFEQVRGKRIGLVTNPTGVDRYLNSTVDVLFNAPDVELVALFGRPDRLSIPVPECRSSRSTGKAGCRRHHSWRVWTR